MGTMHSINHATNNAQASNVLSSSIAYAAAEVTAKAAIAAHAEIGRGDEKKADQVAVNAMRADLDALPINGRVVIGEGERDEAPMLYIGEEIGQRRDGDRDIDIALDPLEGTTLTAKAKENALTVLAMAPRGTLLYAPDVYMQKLIVGPNIDASKISLDQPIKELLSEIAQQLNKEIKDVGVCMLERDRHADLLAEIRSVGARVQLIQDGDIGAAILASSEGSDVDVYVGTGGAPEGVLAAAALKTLGGFIYGRLIFRNDAEKARAIKTGITDFDRIYTLSDMVSSDVIFAMTGVTDGCLVRGVEKGHDNGFRVQESQVQEGQPGESKTYYRTETFVTHYSAGKIMRIESDVAV